MSNALSPGTQRIIGELVALLEEKEQEIEKLRRKNDNRKKLSQKEAGLIRAMYETGNFSQRDLADSFDVNPSTVKRILDGTYY